MMSDEKSVMGECVHGFKCSRVGEKKQVIGWRSKSAIANLQLFALSIVLRF